MGKKKCDLVLCEMNQEEVCIVDEYGGKPENCTAKDYDDLEEIPEMEGLL